MANHVKKLPFRHAQVGTFFQAQPKLENPYLGDGLLNRLLKRLVPDDEVIMMLDADIGYCSTISCHELKERNTSEIWNQADLHIRLIIHLLSLYKGI